MIVFHLMVQVHRRSLGDLRLSRVDHAAMAGNVMMASSLGKMPTTTVPRLISVLSRSIGLLECNLVRCCAGNVMYPNVRSWCTANARLQAANVRFIRFVIGKPTVAKVPTFAEKRPGRMMPAPIEKPPDSEAPPLAEKQHDDAVPVFLKISMMITINEGHKPSTGLTQRIV